MHGEGLYCAVTQAVLCTPDLLESPHGTLHMASARPPFVATCFRSRYYPAPDILPFMVTLHLRSDPDDIVLYFGTARTRQCPPSPPLIGRDSGGWSKRNEWPQPDREHFASTKPPFAVRACNDAKEPHFGHWRGMSQPQGRMVLCVHV